LIHESGAFKRLGAPAKDHNSQVFQQKGNRHGSREQVDAGKIPQGLVGGPFNNNTHSGGHQDCQGECQPPGQHKHCHAIKCNVRAKHDQVAVGEVDQAQDPVHHGVTNGDQRIQAAQRDPIGEVLEKCLKIHVCFSRNTIRVISRYRLKR